MSAWVIFTFKLVDFDQEDCPIILVGLIQPVNDLKELNSDCRLIVFILIKLN